ncbi:MAG: NADH-quinone oxidoreductase subunit J [Alphaproteobacteria bacterium]|nr:NADH-quinone oxidoreductase subunit J [Alphaproteobacteria bacterium]OJV45547.1 MAG: NADH:ubiquinone oxidoreductase subunit J [Alphaproteobacteria bacterium 43-37]
MSVVFLTFLLFSVVLLSSAVMVISARNPVHSVLFLILCFFNAAGIFVLLGAELLAMSLVIVYVGAVAVLFLFVVMMFDLHLGVIKQEASRYKSIGILVGLVLVVELGFLYMNWQSASNTHEILSHPITPGRTNAHAIGDILYTDYFFVFQLAGLVLLVAIIGAIVLTLKDQATSKRQSISRQLQRNPQDAVTLVNPEKGKGVRL